MNKMEKAVKFGRAARDKSTLGFPNYFAAQKVRAKVSQQDEKLGNKQILGKEKKPAKGKRGAPQDSEDEGAYDGGMSEAEGTMTFRKDKTHEIDLGDLSGEEAEQKHAVEKARVVQRLQATEFPKMLFYLKSGFNIVAYGIGSKRQFLNDFVAQHITSQQLSCLVVNGYHSGTTIKSLLGSIFNYLKLKCALTAKKPASLQDLFDYCKRGLYNLDGEVLTVVIHSLD